MILVFGGTTEGKRVCTALAGTGYPFWYSSKTLIEVNLPENGQYRYGAFTPAGLEDFCTKNRIKGIIHAGHPFAAALHKTIAEVSMQMSIPVIRFERKYLPKQEHPLLKYMISYEEVLNQLSAAAYEPVLSLTGVQTIARLQTYWQTKKMFFRILPRESSVALARAAGFPVENLLLSFPGTTVEAEHEVIRATRAQAVITKESGESGFLSVKTAAAIAAGIPLFIIDRPALPAHFKLVRNEMALLEQVKTIYV
jgi:precorrin-6A/cobalt-precorrin-6A reductase